MAISFGNNIIIYTTWTDLKTVASNNALPIQYHELSDRYVIFIVDANVVQTCNIYTGTIPNFIDPDAGDPIDQATNDSDKSDFETNYKATANKNIQVIWSAERIIAAGNIPNGLAEVVGGYRGTSATTRVQLTATTYTEPGSAAQRSVSSSNANDTSAGTGTRTLRITYYDNDMNGPYTEDITMNGTTPVNTVASDIRFIERIESLTVG